MSGFQTCRMLERSGLAAAVVFLSIHDADEIVSAAFRCGGRGYVVKRRVGSDLVGAIDHALDGRSFVPSLSSLLPLAGDGLHAMQLHQDEEVGGSSGAQTVPRARRDRPGGRAVNGRCLDRPQQRRCRLAFVR